MQSGCDWQLGWKGLTMGRTVQRIWSGVAMAALGIEVVTYFDTPVAVQTAAGEQIGQVVHTGELTYRVNTDEPGRLGFGSTGEEVTATFDIRGESSTLTTDGGSPPVTYTCSGSELTQNATGYEAVFTPQPSRLGLS